MKVTENSRLNLETLKKSMKNKAYTLNGIVSIFDSKTALNRISIFTKE